MKYVSKWTDGLDPKSKAEIEYGLKHVPPILKRLKEMLQKDLAEVEGLEIKVSDYASPSWAYLQAHRNGEKARLKKTLDLLSF